MNSLTIFIGILILSFVVGSMYIVQRMRRFQKHVIIFSILLFLMFIFSYVLWGTDRCKNLQTYGFDYKKIRGGSPTWDTYVFFFEGNGQKGFVKGPRITGDRLKITCRDVDKDGIAEFIIRSQVWKTYHTILKVNIKTGRYHVEYTEGLRINYPQEGYYHD